MSSSIDPAMRQALESFLGEDLQRAEGDAGPLFGHITMPPFQLEGVPQVIFDLLPVDRAKTFIIHVSTDEVEMPDVEDGQLPIENFTFSDFLNLLIRNIQQGMGGRGGSVEWPSAKNYIKVWPEKRVLPHKAVIVMQLNSQVSAECALALTCAVDWACAEFDFERDIRLITISSPIGPDLLFNLVAQQQDEPHVALCDIASLVKRDAIDGCTVFTGHSPEQTAKKLYDAIKRSNDIKRLVVSFDEGVEDQLMDLLSQEEKEKVHQVQFFPSSEASTRLKLTGNSKPGRTTFATVLGQFEHLPLRISVFQEVHLVLSRIDCRTPAWDNISRQVLAYPHWTSKQDRLSQTWWAYQPKGVAVSVYSDKYEPSAFVNEGVNHVRLVQGAQLSGYIAAALDLMSMGIGSRETIQLFVQSPLIIEDMKQRLAMQGLISTNGLNLNETEAQLFRCLLPKVNYDHRLAMLLALDSSAAVRRVKAQFAAVLISETSCRFIYDNVDDVDRQTAFNCCRGLVRSLASQGTTWAALGLTKYRLAVASDPKGRSKLSDIVDFNDEAVNVVSDVCYELLETFLAFGIEVDTDSMATETDELNEAETLQLQRDLFQAYMHQIVFFSYQNGSDGRSHVPEFMSLTSMKPCGFSVHLSTLDALIDVDGLTRATGFKTLFGISHTLNRSFGSLAFDHWVLIPDEVVTEWSADTGLSHCNLVSTFVHQESNSAEVTSDML
ncbi:uncharacterized protein FIESC28_07403 [Fusarium coffeatum]|uniref:Uncharacterized protein n=1 Tax=Fusarium coffeatum TaxID=231269 RepID=A0A366RDL3_9HYPO|nr:uncharacterized protein FIESC28_07403 [Fusarium coffeatum]RBR15223.1 hypothetical protein FIESC28_07403 [Fusarium coffeatum]